MKEFVLAVDIGGTKIETALVDKESRILKSSRNRIASGSTPSDILFHRLVESIELSLASCPKQSTILGIGIGSAGPINRDTQKISPLNIVHWRNFPIVEKLTQHFDIPISLIGDGQAITLAEHRAGAGVGYRSIMGMIVSTGIGGGIIVNNQLITGRTGNAGHIGHLMVPVPDKELDPDGVSPIPLPYVLERNASGPSTVRRATRFGVPASTGEELAHIVSEGDRHEKQIAESVIIASGKAIGNAIIGASALLELERVIIAGGFMNVSDLLMETIKSTVQNHYFEFIRNTEIVASPIRDGGPLIGAAAPIFFPEYVS